MKKIKTLWEQLTDEQIKIFNFEAEKYPNTYESIKKELLENFGSTFIKITNAITLHNLYNPNKNFELNRFFNIFNN